MRIEPTHAEALLAARMRAEPVGGDRPHLIEQIGMLGRLKGIVLRHEVQHLEACCLRLARGAPGVRHGRPGQRERRCPDHRILADMERPPAAFAVERQPLGSCLEERELPIALGAVAREVVEQGAELLCGPDRVSDHEQRVRLEAVRDHRAAVAAEEIVAVGKRERADRVEREAGRDNERVWVDLLDRPVRGPASRCGIDRSSRTRSSTG